jgi:hypothetical protein
MVWCYRLVMVILMKGGGRAPPTVTSPGQFYPHDWMYARKQPLLLCVLCATDPATPYNFQTSQCGGDKSVQCTLATPLFPQFEHLCVWIWFCRRQSIYGPPGSWHQQQIQSISYSKKYKRYRKISCLYYILKENETYRWDTHTCIVIALCKEDVILVVAFFLVLFLRHTYRHS